MDLKDFEEIVKKNQRMIYNLCYRFMNNHSDASEAMQKTFMKAFEKIETFEGRSNIKTWLYSISVNICKNDLRAKKRRSSSSLDESRLTSRNDTLGETLRKEQRNLLSKELSELPSKQKDVVTLRIYSELPFSEIAQILNISENSAKVNFHTALKKLKEKVKTSNG